MRQLQRRRHFADLLLFLNGASAAARRRTRRAVGPGQQVDVVPVGATAGVTSSGAGTPVSTFATTAPAANGPAGPAIKLPPCRSTLRTRRSFPIFFTPMPARPWTG